MAHPTNTPRSLAQDYPKRSLLFVVVLLAILACFGFGIALPFVTISKFMFFDHTVSILSSLGELVIHSEYAVFLIIFVFTIITPIIKLILMCVVWFTALEKRTKYLYYMEKYGKWSMLDVFVVAVMVVMIKLDGIAQVEVHLGAYLFAVSVLGSMLLTHWLGRLLRGVT